MILCYIANTCISSQLCSSLHYSHFDVTPSTNWDVFLHNFLLTNWMLLINIKWQSTMHILINKGCYRIIKGVKPLFMLWTDRATKHRFKLLISICHNVSNFIMYPSMKHVPGFISIRVISGNLTQILNKIRLKINLSMARPMPLAFLSIYEHLVAFHSYFPVHLVSFQ